MVQASKQRSFLNQFEVVFALAAAMKVEMSALDGFEFNDVGGNNRCRSSCLVNAGLL
jgi:hypothetical protein